MDLKETRCEDVEWILLAEGSFQWRALVNTAMNIKIDQLLHV
jgi:hypothetical protein